MAEDFRAHLITNDADRQAVRKIRLSADALMEGNITIAVPHSTSMTRTIGFDVIPGAAEDILTGRIRGRLIVELAA
ncbi:MAG TPA: hypothetical protein VGL35_07885 [Rhizomicrobium sp.]|jgi:hypothetical protein